MKILLDATALHGRVGGVETHLVNLLRAWEDAGPRDQFLVYTTNDATQAFRDVVALRGRLRIVGGQSFPSRFAMQQAMLRYAMQKDAPDVLLAATPVMPMVPSRVPVVAVVHDFRYLSNPEEFSRLQLMYRNLAYTYCYQHASALIAISETTRDKLIEVCPEAAEHTSVIYHGADHVDDWPRAAVERHQAISFGHWSNKRPDLSIRVWAELRDTIPGFDWALNIVGADARVADQLRTLVSELKLDALVAVHPFLSHDEFQRLFAASGLLLFPSTAEGFGFPVVEAMRLGIPIVTSDIPALREIAVDAALFAKPDSIADFALHCAKVVESEAYAEQVKSRGLARSRMFTWRQTAEETRHVLQRACGKEELLPLVA